MNGNQPQNFTSKNSFVCLYIINPTALRATPCQGKEIEQLLSTQKLQADHVFIDRSPSVNITSAITPNLSPQPIISGVSILGGRSFVTFKGLGYALFPLSVLSATTDRLGVFYFPLRLGVSFFQGYLDSRRCLKPKPLGISSVCLNNFFKAVLGTF
jgi:hypothetical protein